MRAVYAGGGHFNPRPSYEERLPRSIHLLFIREDFNPRPSYEERPGGITHVAPSSKISIHAPHTRSDFGDLADAASALSFQSTPLIRGATSTGSCRVTCGRFQSTPLIRGATCYDV